MSNEEKPGAKPAGQENGHCAAVRMRIIAEMEKTGIGEEELARLVKEDVSAVRSWISGESVPGRNQLRRIADACLTSVMNLEGLARFDPGKAGSGEPLHVLVRIRGSETPLAFPVSPSISAMLMMQDSREELLFPTLDNRLVYVNAANICFWGMGDARGTDADFGPSEDHTGLSPEMFRAMECAATDQESLTAPQLIENAKSLTSDCGYSDEYIIRSTECVRILSASGDCGEWAVAPGIMLGAIGNEKDGDTDDQASGGGLMFLTQDGFSLFFRKESIAVAELPLYLVEMHEAEEAREALKLLGIYSGGEAEA